MKYTAKLMYYSYRMVEVEANSEEEATKLAMQNADENAFVEIGKNAILEGVEDVAEIEEEKDTTPKKVAKLVTFEYTTRVIVNKSDMPEVEEEDAMNAAIDKVKYSILNDLCYDHCTEIVDDKECPYGTFNDDTK